MKLERLNYLVDTLIKNKAGIPVGVFSICSSNPFVIKAGMKRALEDDSPVLIESTCNQVNQFGGYSGMKPGDFRHYVEEIARQVGFPLERILLGGDHLGPFPWAKELSETAMNYAGVMVHEYVMAGYQKIHLDASMYCADDDHSKPLSKQLSVQRAVRMCRGIEAGLASCDEEEKPLYVIGTEVPSPGGQQEINDTVQVSTVEDTKETIAMHKEEFYKAGLASAWERVIAVVVQPGVEFNEKGVIDYNDSKTGELKNYIESVPRITYEAHSTDYQTVDHLQKLVRDHFAILKVGPALTFAYREALLGLLHIEEQLATTGRIKDTSRLLTTIRQVMKAHPVNWQSYLPRDENLELAKIFSYSDRVRYYWPDVKIQSSVDRLMQNLKQIDIPLQLVSQYFPHQYERIREGLLENTPEELILDHIGREIAKYSKACTN